MDIKLLREIAIGLELIGNAIPDYSFARSRGIPDEDAEIIVQEALSDAINIIEEKLELFEMREKFDKIRKENSWTFYKYYMSLELLFYRNVEPGK